MAVKRRDYQTGFEAPDLNSKPGEVPEDSHTRRKSMLVPIVEQMVAIKEAAGAFGTFAIEIVWRNGMIHSVDITDRTSYK